MRLNKKWKSFWLLCLLLVIGAFLLRMSRIEGEIFPANYSAVVWSDEGEIMSARIASDAQWRMPPSSLNSIKFKKALLEFEDKRFYQHFGLDLRSVARALWSNIIQGKVVSGASTLTMQIARMSARAHGHAHRRSFGNKILESLQAIQLEWRYDKNQLLDLYVNHAPYGGNIVGIGAASWKYFQCPPSELSWGQATLLAVLPNNPAYLHLGSKREVLKIKRDQLLLRLFKQGLLSEEELSLALEESLPQGVIPSDDIAPHLLNCKKCTKNTLKEDLQKTSQAILNQYIQSLIGQQIHNAAVLVIDHETSEPLVYLGNQSIIRDHENSVDMVQAKRSPGSTLKPFLFAQAMEQGVILPQTLLPDYPSRFGTYRPQNYSKDFYGAVPAWRALSESLNIPAVHLLQQIGVGPFQQHLADWGFHYMQKTGRYYGLTLALGGAESSLWEITHAYSKLAALSMKKIKGPIEPSTAIQVLKSLQKVNKPQDAKIWENLGYGSQMAWKTGTSWGFRDAWAIGVTPRYSIGVWVGNATGEGRPELTGVKKAAPLLFKIEALLKQMNSESNQNWNWQGDFFPVNICKKTGLKANEYCQKEIVLGMENSHLLKVDPYHKKVKVNPKGQRVHSKCSDFHHALDSIIFELPPKMAHYYRKHHPGEVSQLKWSDKCPIAQQLFEINYPDPSSVLVLPRLLNQQYTELVMEANHSDPSAHLDWFLDGKYLGRTREIHQMTEKLAAGQHQLSIQDSDGQYKSVEFQVELISE